MNEQGLGNVFAIHVRQDIIPPPSFISHRYEVVAVAPIGKAEWEGSVWTKAMRSKKKFSNVYRNYQREIENWMNAQLKKSHIDDRTLSVLVQIYTGNHAPNGNMMVLSGSNSFINFLLGKNGSERAVLESRNKVNLPVIKDYMSALKAVPDNSLSAIILDYGLSNMVDPLQFFDLVAKKLSQNGLYCHIDRKAYEDFPDQYYEDGVARILEYRKVAATDGKIKHFFIPKIFIKDLPLQMRNKGLAVIFDTSNDPRFTYEILIGVKSSTPIDPVGQKEIVESGWNQLNLVKQNSKKIWEK